MTLHRSAAHPGDEFFQYIIANANDGSPRIGVFGSYAMNGSNLANVRRLCHVANSWTTSQKSGATQLEVELLRFVRDACERLWWRIIIVVKLNPTQAPACSNSQL
jgi:hypothetical protein